MYTGDTTCRFNEYDDTQPPPAAASFGSQVDQEEFENVLREVGSWGVEK